MRKKSALISQLFLGLFLFLGFFTFLPSRVYAVLSLNTTHLYSNTPTATFVITSDTDVFVGGDKQYGVWVYKADKGKSASTRLHLHRTDARTLTIPNVPIKLAYAPPVVIPPLSIPVGESPIGRDLEGDWKISGCEFSSAAKLLIPLEFLACARENFKFNAIVHVNKPGVNGVGVPAIVTEGKIFKYGVPVKVGIRNAAPDISYSVWWYSPNFFHATGATVKKFTPGELSPQDTPPQDTGTMTIDTPQEGAYYLCMAQGEPTLPLTLIGLDCDFSIKDIQITTDEAEATGAPREKIFSNESGIPREPDLLHPTIACDKYVDTATGDILTAGTPAFSDPSVNKECVPGSIGHCAEYRDPRTNSIIPTEQLERVAYKECTKVGTAVGNINVNTGDFVKSLLGILLGISGGIAILLIISAGYTLITSQGEATKVQGARETITSAIVGLLFIIFSLVILEIIGYDLLHLPGFGR